MSTQATDNMPASLAGTEIGVTPIKMATGAFIRTIEGQQIVRESKIFVNEGHLWQGYRLTVVMIDDDQVTDQELAEAIDVDGSKKNVFHRLKNAARQQEEFLKDEKDKRAAVDRKEELDKLQLKKLQQETGTVPETAATELNPAMFSGEQPPQDAPAPIQFPAQANPQDAKLDAILGAVGGLTQGISALVEKLQHVPAPVVDRPEPEGKPRVKCNECGKQSPPNHKNPGMWLRGHNLKAHKATQG